MEEGGKGGKKTREMRWGGLVNDEDSVRGEREQAISAGNWRGRGDLT